MEIFDRFEINMDHVNEHYEKRRQASSNLKSYMINMRINDFNELALGVNDPVGNYSAYMHGLGEKILAYNNPVSVYNLCRKLSNPSLKKTHIPETIYKANISYLKISVGSEIACLLQPEKFWIANVRTIYTHLILKHDGSIEKANAELELYKLEDTSSEMTYKVWRDIYLSIESSLEKIKQSYSNTEVNSNGISQPKSNLWADAFCSILYEMK